MTDPAPPAGLRERICRSLAAEGFWTGTLEAAGRPAAALLELARGLGEVYVPEGCDPSVPVIATRPTAEPGAAPFDRPEPIGWHGDFASHADRPQLSLVLVTRADPSGEDAGAWRLASVRDALDRAARAPDGPAAIGLLGAQELPFSYSPEGEVRWFKAIEERGGERCLRFYKPSIERGCLAAYGEVPPSIAVALDLIATSADRVGMVRKAPAGSLLVTDNWRALHDRTAQSLAAPGSGREALLAFVARIGDRASSGSSAPR